MRFDLFAAHSLKLVKSGAFTFEQVAALTCALPHPLLDAKSALICRGVVSSSNENKGGSANLFEALTSCSGVVICCEVAGHVIGAERRDAHIRQTRTTS